MLPRDLERVNLPIAGECVEDVAAHDGALRYVGADAEAVVEGDIAVDAGSFGGIQDGVGNEVAEVRLAEPRCLRAVLGKGHKVDFGGADFFPGHLVYLRVELGDAGGNVIVGSRPRVDDLARHARGDHRCLGRSR